MISPRSLSRWILLLVLAAAAVKVSWHVWEVAALEARGAIDSDALLYFTVGKGILNGLTPWADLFESKPPGMFLIAALSLLTTGDELLALALQITIYALLPAGLAWAAWFSSRERGETERWIAALAGCVAGALLALYLQERAGGIQGESFGTAFAFLYLLLLYAWRDVALSPARIAALSVPLLAAIGTKEPFVLSILAGALAVSSGVRTFARGFVLPLLLAAALGLLTLLLTGWLRPYLDIYIPSMLQGRLESNPLEPPLFRGFAAGRVFGNLTEFYTAPLLGWLLAYLWVLFPVLRAKRTPPLPDIGITVLASWLGYYVMTRTFLYLATWQAYRLGLELEQAVIPLPTPLFLLVVAALVFLYAVQWSRKLLGQTLIAFAGLFLTSAAVGLSIYATNHFAFALPPMLALILASTRAFTQEKAKRILLWPAIAVAVAAAMLYSPSEKHLATMQDRLAYSSVTNAERVARVDGMLDACGVERYGSLGAFMTLGFAKHSPIGPLFITHFFDYLGKDHPLFARTTENIAQAKVIISAGGEDADRRKELLEQKFTQSPPECAKEHLPIEGLQFYWSI